MLKLAMVLEEKRGALIMESWNGKGAVKVLAVDGDALLMERATGKISLTELSGTGHDDEASRIICKTAEKLHANEQKATQKLFIPLYTWFEELRTAAVKSGGIFSYCLNITDELLAMPQNIKFLHGDLHHGNILECNNNWLAIDPKGLVGERAYDFANIFCNPSDDIACLPGRLGRQVEVVAKETTIDSKRLIKWIIAYTGLSAAWLVQHKKDPDVNFSIIEIAVAELDK